MVTKIIAETVRATLDGTVSFMRPGQPLLATSTQTNNQLPPIFFFIGLGLFPVFWYFVIWNISKMSGWQRLAESFPARTQPNGQKFIISGAVGRASYNGCLRVFVSHDGLFLSVTFLFSPGHKPLFIPWSAIHNHQVEKLFWREMVRFDIGDPCIATMQLPKKTFDKAAVKPEGWPH